MSDEIYEYLLYDEVRHVSPASFSPEAAESTITVSGFSKTFSMTGWRLGTLMASPSIAKAVAGIQSRRVQTRPPLSVWCFGGDAKLGKINGRCSGNADGV